jgi:hypothetical protein
MQTLTPTGILFTVEKATQICNTLNKEDTGKRMYAPMKIGKYASVEVFDSDGYSIGFL